MLHAFHDKKVKVKEKTNVITGKTKDKSNVKTFVWNYLLTYLRGRGRWEKWETEEALPYAGSLPTVARLGI